jgi:hypothetical protein
MSNNALLDELSSLVGGVYSELNQEGINLQARYDVMLRTYRYENQDKHKRHAGDEKIVNSLELTVIKLELKDVHQFINGQNERVGDARLEVATHNVTREQLLSEDLAVNQKRYFLIDGDRYTPVNGTYENRNGLKHILTLKRVKQ